MGKFMRPKSSATKFVGPNERLVWGFYSCHGAFVEGPGEQPQVLYEFKERNFSIYEPAVGTFTMS